MLRSILSGNERDSLYALRDAKDELIRHYTKPCVSWPSRQQSSLSMSATSDTPGTPHVGSPSRAAPCRSGLLR